MTSIANKHQRYRLLLLIIGLLLLGFCLLTILPWSATGYGFDLDQSWAIALHVAFANKFQFGKDFVYTYGPYGFIQVDIYHPDTYGYLFALRFLIAVAVWAGLFKLMRYCLARRDGRVIWLIPILLFFPNMSAWMEYFQFMVVILPVVLYFYVSKRISPTLVLTIATLALASLVKHTYLLLGVLFVVLITIDEIFKLKRIPRIAILYLVFCSILWSFALQDWANIPAYIINNWQTVSGFSYAMGIAGNSDEILLYLGGTGLYLLLVGLVEWRSRRWWGLLPTLALGAIFFITFKGSFTRHDSHALQAFFNTIPIVLIFTAVLWEPIWQYSWRWVKGFKVGIMLFVASLLVLLSMSYIIQARYLSFETGSYVTNAMRSAIDKTTPAISLITGKTDLTANATIKKTEVQQSNALPPTAGTVDLYPNEIASIFAYDLPYRPRPVFQSFSAYTKKLAQLNAQHLTSDDAAESILFDINPIDGHLASFEDGLSWTELLTRYDITNLEGRYLLLKRSSQPREYQFKAIAEDTISLGEWYEVPDNSQPVWAKLDLHPNLRGKLTAAALRLPDLYLEIETADGVQIKYRTIPKLLDAGFLISPVLSTRWDFLALATPDWQQRLVTQQVTRFRIVEDELNSRLYPSEFRVALSQLTFPRQDFKEVVGWQRWSQYLTPKPLSGTLQRIPRNPQQFVWLAHAPARLALELEGTERQLAFKFGILDEGVASALEKSAGDGVEFRIVIEQNERETVLFSRQLHPQEVADRGIQQATVDLTGVDATQLILETGAGRNTEWDWSYWSELKAK